MGDPTQIYNILDTLSESDFKRYKSYLSKPILDGFPPIHWGKLEKADVTDVERLMRDHYEGQGSMKIMMHVIKTQFGKSSQDVSTGSTGHIMRAPTGVKYDFDSLTLENSKTDDRLSSVATPSTVTAVPRKWISCSQRWQDELRELANMEEKGVMKVGSLIFVPDEERYQIADKGHIEVLLGLREDGTEVAIKKIKKSREKMVKKELDILVKKRYNSLHVVQYVDSTEDNKYAYIAMQLCEHNLEEYIGSLREDSERKKTAKEFLEGLKELHEEGVIHGDIKPSNVLIERNGCVRLADFGISRTLDPDQSTIETDRAGTKCWEATEILKSSSEGQYKYKQSGDIQVAGMLVYYILSGGHHPFGDGIPCQTNILDGKYSLEHLKDKEAKDLVMSMITPFNPKQRPHITKVLTHSYWEDRSVDAQKGDKEEEEEEKEEEEDNLVGITHIANATEMPMRVYFSEDVIEEMVVESSQTWWTWQDKKVNFRPIACDPYICVPAKTFERLLKKGPFYVSIFLESISSSGECAKIVAENVCIPNNRSFIVTKKHTFEMQKYGANIWKDEQGKNHTP